MKQQNHCCNCYSSSILSYFIYQFIILLSLKNDDSLVSSFNFVNNLKIRTTSAPKSWLNTASSSATSSSSSAEYDAAAALNGLDDNGEIELESRWLCPEHNDVCTRTGVTLSRYMLEMERANPELTDIESIFISIQVASKTISNLVRTASLTGITGLVETDDGGSSINIQGEEQKKLDVITNEVFKNALKWNGKLGTLASEEEDVPVLLDNLGNKIYSGDLFVEEGRYVAVFDPLDGSSNVDANIPVGTIFGIFENNDECLLDDDDLFNEELDVEALQRKCVQRTLQPGKNLVAAGYCLYSAATTLVFTIGNGVQGYTLDESIGEFVLTHPDIKIPPRGKIYSMNESNRHDWDQPMKDYISDIQQGLGDTKTKYTSRYVGSMVADVHRTLLYGGIFGYPADLKNPDGKLRLLYEAAPMAFLMEQAGGYALTGKNRIMDIPPQNVHQRVPCILGSRLDVAELRRYYEASDDPDLIERCNARLKAYTNSISAGSVAD